ncbi:MAG: DUF4124 domain-containing protein [Betaproteobacteria bacterium HGW-Betaproteobacteria-7]|jgi:hypothetical protein|nr:MAG: DUF4124 domain-containing protein [Betaproteobacteria bacterium HGW-Betaproteobacteria-7]
MTMIRIALALLIGAASLPAAAQTIYKCVDDQGGTLISTTRANKDCKAVVSSPETSVPAPRQRAATAAANPTPASFPRVQEDTQKARDNDRRHILEQELAGEQRNLTLAKRELAEQEGLRGPSGAGGIDRTAPYRDRVAQHERNIVAIQKELSGLR